MFPPANIRLHPALWCFLGVLASAGLGWLAFHSTDWSGTARAFLKTSWLALLPAVASTMLATLLQAARWKLFLPNEKVSVVRLYQVRTAGESMNHMVPLPVAGEATELVMLTRTNDVDGSKVAASIFVSRSLDLMVTTTMMCIGLLAVPQFAALEPFILPSLALTAVIGALLLFSGRIGRIKLLRDIRPLQAFLLSVRTSRCAPRLILAAALTATAWLALGVGAWLIAQTLGIELPFWKVAVALVMIIFLNSVIPGAPASLGVFEFASLYILGLFGVAASSALAFAFIIHALIFLPHLAVGVPVLCREHRALFGTTRLIGHFFARLAVRPQPVA